VSEYPLGAQPQAINFPPAQPDPSAACRSGQSSSRRTLEQRRAHHLLALPGNKGREVSCHPAAPYSPRVAGGTNQLIQRGAKLIPGVTDVLEELNLTMVSEQASGPSRAARRTKQKPFCLQHISAEPVHVDDLGAAVSLPIAQVSSTLCADGS